MRAQGSMLSAAPATTSPTCSVDSGQALRSENGELIENAIQQLQPNVKMFGL